MDDEVLCKVAGGGEDSQATVSLEWARSNVRRAKESQK
jgi:hypothetical protein